MTTLHEAAQQALEALEELNGWQSLAPPLVSHVGRQAAINLRAALEQRPEPQPVARAPLTDEQIKGIYNKWRASVPLYLNLARAVEAAHGIKQEETK